MSSASDSWDSSTVRAAVFGIADPAAAPTSPAAPEPSDPESFFRAAQAFQRARDAFAFCRQEIQQHARAIAGAGKVWQGATAEEFLQTTGYYGKVMQAHVEQLDDYPSGERPVVRGLVDAGNQLDVARRQLDAIEAYHANDPKMFSTGYAADGSIVCSAGPTPAKDADMRTVLNGLESNYHVNYAAMKPPPPQRITPPGGAGPGPAPLPNPDDPFGGGIGVPGGGGSGPGPMPNPDNPFDGGIAVPGPPSPDNGFDAPTALAGLPSAPLATDTATPMALSGGGLGGGSGWPGAGARSAPGAFGAGGGVAGAVLPGGADPVRALGSAGPYGTPMGAPLGAGMAPGGQPQERERVTWLVEDSDIWGDNPDLPPEVVGR
ncbi:hypothetical protein [Krasilnikovia sp. M28-CT-15]|uniref:hypothetical protein n=1 Tax=Krasilnikovia sp. M28-CT-15 TaxID=3373540 RepID=UPI00387783D6